MANLTLNLGSPVTGNYRVSFRDDEGNLLSSPFLTQNQVIALSNSSIANITIGNGVYTLDNINIRLEALSDTACNDEINTDLDVNCPSSVCTVVVNDVTESCVSTSINIVIAASTTGTGALEYGISTTIGVAPSSWQSINQFNGLLQATTYYIYVRNTENPSVCLSVTSYTTGSCLPNCGCGDLSSFAVESITRVGFTNIYNVSFNACVLSSANWRVKNLLGTIIVSGSVIPTSGVLSLDFGTLSDGNYIFELDSTICLGQASKSFVVTSPLTCPECYELVEGNCVSIPDCGTGGGGSSSIFVEDFIIDEPTGKTIAFSLSGGTIGEPTTIDLKQGSITVGSVTTPYNPTITVSSSQYGYVDVNINNVYKSTVYLPLRLTGAFSVEESKAVDENDGFMKLVYTQQSNGEFIVSDSASPSFSTIYYNVNGKWRTTLSGLKLEPLTNHSITKFAYSGAYWGDTSGAQDKKQLSFRIKEGDNSESKELIFVVNLTGNAFDFNNAGNHYISNDKLTLIQDALTGANSEVVDAIRMPFIWGDYNPSSGVYKDAEMTTAINWVKSLRPSLPVKIDLLIVPILGGNDSRIPSDELHVDNNGNVQDCTYNFNTVPSYFSNTAKTLITTMLNHLITRLVSVHSSDIRILEYGAGQSEEHYMPYTANYAGCGCGSCFGGIGDYSTGAALPAWRIFLSSKYGSGNNLPYLINGVQYTTLNAMLPNVGVTPGNNYNMNYSQEAYRDLFRFYSKGIFDTWKNFHDRVKALSSFKTGFVIADFLNEQGTKWIFHGGAIFLAMKFADQFYHTYNIHPGEWYANLWGTDVLLGTFPNSGKLSAIEYDNFDAGATGGGSLNTAHVRDSILRFIKNGGKVVHTALGWTTPQMTQWKALIKDVKDNYINNPSWLLEDRDAAATVNVNTADLFTTPYIYRDAWTSVGGNHVQSNPQAYNAAPLNINILNNGTIDNFWI